jgi:prepilin-type N-terminal cleavage/methylation domain-containing protein
MLKAKKGRLENGFVLVELLIAIIVISVLSGVAVPTYFSLANRSRIAADKQSISILNNATKTYAVAEDINKADIFDGIATDDARMQALVNSGYLKAKATPQEKGAVFQWDIASQEWKDNTGTGVVDLSKNYDFKSVALSDFLTGPGSVWKQTADGIKSNLGLLFIENKNAAYTLTSNAVLDAGTGGGYGILFETTLSGNNSDTGYALQFDRGWAGGSIIIRRRFSGNEQNPMVVVTHADQSIIPGSNNDAWWSQPHEVKLQVSPVAGVAGKKQISVWIDGTKINKLDMQIDSSIAPESNYTGLRSWWPTETVYKNLTIMPN